MEHSLIPRSPPLTRLTDNHSALHRITERDVLGYYIRRHRDDSFLGLSETSTVTVLLTVPVLTRAYHIITHNCFVFFTHLSHRTKPRDMKMLFPLTLFQIFLREDFYLSSSNLLNICLMQKILHFWIWRLSHDSVYLCFPHHRKPKILFRNVSKRKNIYHKRGEKKKSSQQKIAHLDQSYLKQLYR